MTLSLWGLVELSIVFNFWNTYTIYITEQPEFAKGHISSSIFFCFVLGENGFLNLFHTQKKINHSVQIEYILHSIPKMN